MTNTAAADSSPALEFFQLWSDAFAHVLQQIAGSPMPCCTVQDAPSGLKAPNNNDLYLLAAASGALRGEFCLRVPLESVSMLAGIFLGTPDAAAEPPVSELEEAVIELLRQVGGLAATAIASRWGQVQLRLDRTETPPSWPVSAKAWMQTTPQESEPISVEVQLSAALLAGLKAESKAVGLAESEGVTSADRRQQGNVQLDLLMDVELALTLRFGHRRMLLREILELGPGAVIELDREVSDPVDVLLDGRVVARGEVVVLDGNYGLRVTELGSVI